MKKITRRNTKSQGWRSRLLSLAYVMAMGIATTAIGTSLSACSSSDDDSDNIENPDDKGDNKHVATESILVKAMQSRAANGMELSKWGYFSNIHSTAMSGTGEDSWRIYVDVKNDPGDNKWQGTYQVGTGTYAVVRGFEKGNPWEKEKARLYANKTEDGIVKDAYIKFEWQGTKNDYDQKLYKVTLHIPELKEENGDYARNIDATYTGYVDGGMLEY